MIDAVQSVAFKPGTSYALSLGGDGELHAYDVGSGNNRVYEMPNTAADMKFSPAGRYLACGLDADGTSNVMIIDFEE